MLELLTILTPIAVLDSVSIVPLCIVVMVVLLAGPRPVVRSLSFIFAIFVVYLACGMLVLLGLESALHELRAYTVRLWQSPETEELILQIVIGIVLCAVGLRMAFRGRKVAAKRVTGGMTTAQAFAAGAGLTIVGLPGAVPYLAAIELVLREHLGLKREIVALAYYNAVFVAPLGALVVLHLALGERGRGALEQTRRLLDTWGQRVLVVLLVALGLLLIADGIGWFLGYPLIPV